MGLGITTQILRCRADMFMLPMGMKIIMMTVSRIMMMFILGRFMEIRMEMDLERLQICV